MVNHLKTGGPVRKTAQAPQADCAEQLEILYDHYRDACLNQKYYGHRYVHVERSNSGIEIAIAIGSATSTIGAWPLWQFGVGKVIWATIAGASTILAVVKPFLNYPEKMKKFGRLHAGYVEITTELREIVNNLRIARSLSNEALITYKRMRKMLTQLAREDEPNPNRRLIKRLQAEVNKEIPLHTLWFPPPYVLSMEEITTEYRENG
jgi:hypothetical protein